jgi:hypothetical protein
MQFYTYTTTREACKRSGAVDASEEFYRVASADAVKMGSGQFLGQLCNERDWEKARRPYYNVWPSIVPMLTRLNLDLDSGLIKLPMPALCVRFPKEKNPLTFDWKGEETPIRCMLMGDMNDGKGISILIDVGEAMGDGSDFGVPIYTYRNFRRESGLTVEAAIRRAWPERTVRTRRADPRSSGNGLCAVVLLTVPSGERSHHHLPGCTVEGS